MLLLLTSMYATEIGPLFARDAVVSVAALLVAAASLVAVAPIASAVTAASTVDRAQTPPDVNIATTLLMDWDPVQKSGGGETEVGIVARCA
jgi:hypothetical protein